MQIAEEESEAKGHLDIGQGASSLQYLHGRGFAAQPLGQRTASLPRDRDDRSRMSAMTNSGLVASDKSAGQTVSRDFLGAKDGPEKTHGPKEDATGFEVQVRRLEKSTWQSGRLSLDEQRNRLRFLPARGELHADQQRYYDSLKLYCACSRSTERLF